MDENDFDGSVEPGAEGEGGDDDGDDWSDILITLNIKFATFNELIKSEI